eukprot:GGOE01018904.1.p1 GENE.GGOE01018904.1~~GGOE01018904.1.p1  ORF type:complete len:816 (-),score=153.37 GGOE01018904.1:235-2607(-)
MANGKSQSQRDAYDLSSVRLGSPNAPIILSDCSSGVDAAFPIANHGPPAPSIIPIRRSNRLFDKPPRYGYVQKPLPHPARKSSGAATCMARHTKATAVASNSQPKHALLQRPQLPCPPLRRWSWDGVWRIKYALDDPIEVAAKAQVQWLLAEYNCERARVCLAKKRGQELTRPDLEAMKILVSRKQHLFREHVAGVLPGLPVGIGFMSRAELHIMGFHFPPVGGIDGVHLKLGQQPPLPAPGCPEFPCQPADAEQDPTLVTQEYRGGYATSVTVSGQYEDDRDADGGQRFIYTGEGGNALTASKKQVGHQTLTKGNLKLLGNITLRIPVRVVRKNPDRPSYTKNLYIFDGLYWVTRCWKRAGISGFDVYQYEFVRLPDQPETYSSEVHWGNSDGNPLPANFEAERRPGFCMSDISRGCNRFPDGRRNPIPVVNTVDNTPTPRALLLGEETSDEGKALLANPKGQAFVYIKENLRAPDVPCPAPAPPSACTKEALLQLNQGYLPYSKERRLWGLCKVVYEVPERYTSQWSQADLRHAQCVQLGSTFRLEVYRTHNKGWGVRSWDHIPKGSYVAEFTGLIVTQEAFLRVEEGTNGVTGCARSDYAFDLEVTEPQERYYDDPESSEEVEPRPRSTKSPTDRKRAGRPRKRPATPTAAPPLVTDGPAELSADGTNEQEALYTLDAFHFGNVSRYINHDGMSPNLFVQCVMVEHHDLLQPRLCLFASKNIPPLTELCYDYGESYEEKKLGSSLQERQRGELRRQALALHPLLEPAVARPTPWPPTARKRRRLSGK